MLLDTRRDVLEAHGIQAETRLVEAAPAEPLIRAETALVVACSSLSTSARQTIIDSAHTAAPRLPCLVVEPAFASSTATPEADGIVRALDGPKKFVELIQELIAI